MKANQVQNDYDNEINEFYEMLNDCEFHERELLQRENASIEALKPTTVEMLRRFKITGRMMNAKRRLRNAKALRISRSYRD